MKLNVGDIVRHSSKFLRCIAWHTNVPKNGIIEEVLTMGKPDPVYICRVKWSNGTRGGILSVNLERYR